MSYKVMASTVGLIIAVVLFFAAFIPKTKRKLFWGDTGAEKMSSWSILSWSIFFGLGGVSLIEGYDHHLLTQLLKATLVMIGIGFISDIIIIPRWRKRE